MRTRAKITSKGQITVPLKVREALGVKAGDQLAFEDKGADIVIKPIRRESPFAKYQGIGTPGIGPGRKAVIDFVRDLRDTE
jgi:AbrB family looped-hinge helix DNA binding protein